MTAPLIELRNVSKIYRSKFNSIGVSGRIKDLIRPTYTSHKVIEDLSFKLYEAQSLAILGPNGAGKSTLIKILSGIQRADLGDVRVLDTDPYKKKKDIFKNLGVVFGHKNCLWWDLPLRNSLEMVQPMYGIDRDTFERDLREILDLLNLKKLMDKPVRLLSLGERVKSELAFNLSFRPKILFLDEPTIGLDITSKHEIRELLKSLKHERGVSYIITSHDMGDIDGYVDEIILLHNGKNKFHGNIEELKKIVPSLVSITLFCGNGLEPSYVASKIREISSKTSVNIKINEFMDEDLELSISLSRSDCPLFIRELTFELSCAFSVSTPSLEEMLRVKFKEFN
ncbi:ATP-binding cassette domain-containing protein [Brenneria rubrifaciens]|uniref:ATP-binding cassette domain-containing protein n=1 Tax=Brenneria rubrifaciens TaxID=55213 RepID=A0A4V1F9Y6_9GAMM|nr:ATP-binding cassette domain-containing protein [Brenneria rubrifaciens]QCR09203.1 ATP-binding cassette domain-containing protein [Brenneria rubrifaciens]